MSNRISQNVYFNKTWYIFTLLYLIVDYARPHDVIPAISFIHPSMIISIILIGYLIFSGQLRMVKGKQLVIIYLFIVLLAIHVPFARNNFRAFNTTKGMLLYLPFILSCVILLNNIEKLKQLIFILNLLMIWIAIYGLLHAGKGPGNFLGDENDLALFLNLWLPFGFFLYTVEKNKLRKILFLIGLIIGVLGVVTSFSRGGFVGLALMMIVAWLFSKQKIKSLIIIGILAFLVYQFGGTKYVNEMETITNTEESTARQRIWSWQASWNMFKHNPLGVGGNNFQVRFPEYQPPEFKRAMWGRVAHSLWFTLLPELGIFGVILYFWLLFYNFQDLFQIKSITKRLVSDEDFNYIQQISRAFMASIAGFLASGTFLSVLYYPHFWYLTAFILVTANVTRNLLYEKLFSSEESLEASPLVDGVN